MISEKFSAFAFLGIEPVLWILVTMSVVGVGVMIERALVFRSVEKHYKDIDYYALRLVLEKRLSILATFGNNAPFIGLFGTVLGVIKAFAAIGKNSTFDVAPIMQAISEALVATAVGLFVAIPCVIAYNYFIGRLKVVIFKKEADLNSK